LPTCLTYVTVPVEDALSDLAKVVALAIVGEDDTVCVIVLLTRLISEGDPVPEIKNVFCPVFTNDRDSVLDTDNSFPTRFETDGVPEEDSVTFLLTPLDTVAAEDSLIDSVVATRLIKDATLVDVTFSVTGRRISIVTAFDTVVDRVVRALLITDTVEDDVAVIFTVYPARTPMAPVPALT